MPMCACYSAALCNDAASYVNLGRVSAGCLSCFYVRLEQVSHQDEETTPEQQMLALGSVIDENTQSNAIARYSRKGHLAPGAPV